MTVSPPGHITDRGPFPHSPTTTPQRRSTKCTCSGRYNRLAVRPRRQCSVSQDHSPEPEWKTVGATSFRLRPRRSNYFIATLAGAAMCNCLTAHLDKQITGLEVPGDNLPPSHSNLYHTAPYATGACANVHIGRSAVPSTRKLAFRWLAAVIGLFDGEL